MPWTPKQHRLFEAAAHSPQIAKSSGIPQEKAAQMASEDVQKPAPHRLGHVDRVKLAAALTAKRKG